MKQLRDISKQLWNIPKRRESFTSCSTEATSRKITNLRAQLVHNFIAIFHFQPTLGRSGAIS